MKRMTLFIVRLKLALLFGCLTATACFTADAATTNITYGFFFFNPPVVTINVGDTILWTNGSGAHTVFGTGSDPMCGGASLPCAHTFSSPGSFNYECTVDSHASLGMTGTVIVTSLQVTPATLTNAMRLADGQFQFTVITTANRTNIVQGSTNLSSPTNWTSLVTTVPTANTFTFTDTNAGTLRLRFYRVIEPQ